ncbi:MAG: hypothetical protein OEW05_05285, partial [Candidatus Aminicenantes bacterium]|nr:hypothetical protein [Candidatus Aminicenantes bacterium]
INLREKRIENLSGAGLTLVFDLEVANSSSAAVRLVRYEYRVVVSQKEYLRLPVTLDAPIPVSGRETILIALGVRITYAHLAAVIGPLGERAACEVAGDFVFEDERRRENKVPAAFSGDFPIFVEPVLKFLPLRVNSLSVGGADFVFDAEFHNALSYELLVDRLSFTLELGPQTVLEGEVEGEKSLPAHGDRRISIPVLLDFFETGKEMAGLLARDSVPCRFSGEILMASAWGRLALKFDREDAVAVERTAAEPLVSLKSEARSPGRDELRVLSREP